jgi:5-methylthioadenosine/S-adenosylhomocysteine deaminase
VHKAINYDPSVMPARDIVRMATIDGARVLGKEKSIGSLSAGKLADIITIDLEQPHLVPMYDPYSHLVYCANSSDVENVIINGKIIMRNRKVLTMDEEKILAEAREFQEKIL